MPLVATNQLRLARAELLKLRKRKGVWIPAAFLTVGAIVLVYLILELAHLSNPNRYGPAGGTEHFRHALFLIGQLSGLIAAVMVGTHAGTQDVSAGVFRELVATGRPRTHLFFARVPGGLGLLVPLVALAYALTAVLTVAFAGGGADAEPRALRRGGPLGRALGRRDVLPRARTGLADRLTRRREHAAARVAARDPADPPQRRRLRSRTRGAAQPGPRPDRSDLGR